MEISLLIALGVAFLLIVLPVGLYNGLVSRRNAVENAFASLDANLQKRFDLIPNLVATVKGYATHERETLQALTDLRAQTLNGGRTARLQNDGASAQLVTQILAVAENYPQLQASTNFLHLQRTLNEIEEQISASRRAFNATVSDYNTSLESFPSNLVAGAFGFGKRDFFAADDVSRQNPNVSGSF